MILHCLLDLFNEMNPCVCKSEKEDLHSIKDHGKHTHMFNLALPEFFCLWLSSLVSG
jgi:hypothetical protein